MTHYVELQVLTHFSLLRGASSPEELFAVAALLGYPAIGVSDIGTVGGVVRAWEAQMWSQEPWYMVYIYGSCMIYIPYIWFRV